MQCNPESDGTKGVPACNVSPPSFINAKSVSAGRRRATQAAITAGERSLKLMIFPVSFSCLGFLGSRCPLKVHSRDKTCQENAKPRMQSRHRPKEAATACISCTSSPSSVDEEEDALRHFLFFPLVSCLALREACFLDPMEDNSQRLPESRQRPKEHHSYPQPQHLQSHGFMHIVRMQLQTGEVPILSQSRLVSHAGVAILIT